MNVGDPYGSAAAGTWLMQMGVPMWEVAGFLGMSPEMVQQTYGHHHPAHMHGTAEAIGGHRDIAQSLVISLAEIRKAKEKTAKIDRNSLIRLRFADTLLTDWLAVRVLPGPPFPSSPTVHERSRMKTMPQT